MDIHPGAAAAAPAAEPPFDVSPANESVVDLVRSILDVWEYGRHLGAIPHLRVFVRELDAALPGLVPPEHLHAEETPLLRRHRRTSKFVDELWARVAWLCDNYAVGVRGVTTTLANLPTADRCANWARVLFVLREITLRVDFTREGCLQSNPVARRWYALAVAQVVCHPLAFDEDRLLRHQLRTASPDVKPSAALIHALVSLKNALDSASASGSTMEDGVRLKGAEASVVELAPACIAVINVTLDRVVSRSHPTVGFLAMAILVQLWFAGATTAPAMLVTDAWDENGTPYKECYLDSEPEGYCDCDLHSGSDCDYDSGSESGPDSAPVEVCAYDCDTCGTHG